MPDWKLVEELARIFNLPPILVLYLIWLGVDNFKCKKTLKKQLDAAFTKIRALETKTSKRSRVEKRMAIEDEVDDESYRK